MSKKKKSKKDHVSGGVVRPREEGSPCFYLMQRSKGEWTVEKGEVVYFGTPSTRTGPYRIKAMTGYAKGAIFRAMEETVFRWKEDAEAACETYNAKKQVA